MTPNPKPQTPNRNPHTPNLHAGAGLSNHVSLRPTPEGVVCRDARSGSKVYLIRQSQSTKPVGPVHIWPQGSVPGLGLGCRVQNPWFRIQDSGRRLQCLDLQCEKEIHVYVTAYMRSYIRPHTRVGVVTKDKKMTRCHLPRVVYHQVCNMHEAYTLGHVLGSRPA